MGDIAHIRSFDGSVQTVMDHLNNVSKLSSRYGNKIGVRSMAYLCGLYHDIGKYSSEFSEYIISEASISDPSRSKRGSVDHSTAGGRILFEQFYDLSSGAKLIIEVISNVVLSHHTGILDYLEKDARSNYLVRIKEKKIPNYDESAYHFNEQWSVQNTENILRRAEKEFYDILHKNDPKRARLTITMLTKYLFSCLIDADRTDARCFEENLPLPDSIVDNSDLFRRCYRELLLHLDSINQEGEKLNSINRLRSEMSLQCDLFADKPSGIYTLSIPTGGGKTFSSLRYALKHAYTYGKDRIIYVVPYLSITEQNAKEVRDLFSADDIVFEHHSNVIADCDTDAEEDSESHQNFKKLNLLKDDWDSPIIFTTMVQFLNVIYSRGTRNIRRFHNLANSIIIFDEVQAVPIKCISMFNAALNFLKNVCGTSILLCTATQPALDFVEQGIDQIDGEIVQALADVVDEFKRVDIVDLTRPKGWNTDKLSELVMKTIVKEPSLLIILNTKSAVRKLYKELQTKSDVNIYHLSTSMCSAHRTETLDNVKEHLEKKEPVVCISTQLIEAGVNISFSCVIRSQAGLDSIAQAAGRCNRHGESDEPKLVYIINHSEENLDKLETIRVGHDITGRILLDKRNGYIAQDLLSPEIMGDYFKAYYTELENDLKYPEPKTLENLYTLLSGSTKYINHYERSTGSKYPLELHSSIKTVGDHFNVIDQNTRTVLVPYGKGKELIYDIYEGGDSDHMTALFRKAQLYTVNVFESDFYRLSKSNSIISKLDGKLYILVDNAYDNELGITIDEPSKMELTMM